MKRKRNLKLPNGFGAIEYLGKNRDKPYGARITLKWGQDGKQIRKFVGYGKTWNEAYEILFDYNKKPYDINAKSITVNEVFDKVHTQLLQDMQNGRLSESSYKSYANSWNNHLNILSNKNILDIKKAEVQKIIEDSTLKYTGRNYLKLLWKKLVNYCIDNYHMTFFSNICDIDIGKKEKSSKHKVFQDDEVQKIIEYGKISKMARIITLYLFTGVRPSELLKIKREDVYLDENYMIGGIKNDNSKNRIIPIHPFIHDIVAELYNENHSYLFINDDTQLPMTYDGYRHRFSKVMTELNLDHACHDTRHTFATKCEALGFSDTDIKALLGHSFNNDVTNSVYIHRSKDRLLEIIKKLNYN